MILDGWAQNLGRAILLSLPIIISASLHMGFVKRGILSSLARPLSPKLFGRNKTWRGFILMAVLTTASTILVAALAKGVNFEFRSTIGEGALGFLLGLAYCLAELPNSFLKRRLGIAEGSRARYWPFLFSFLDQADSVLGCVLVYWIFCPFSREVLPLVLLLGPGLHLLGNFSLYRLGLRSAPY